VKRYAAAAITVALAAAASGCYTVAGRPYEGVQTVGVTVFTNRSLYRGLDFILTDAVNRELSTLAGYSRTSPGAADTVIEGELTLYREAPEVIDEDQRAVIERLYATATVRLTDSRSGEVFAGPVSVSWRELHRERGERTIQEARAEVMRKLAREIVVELFLPWPEE